MLKLSFKFISVRRIPFSSAISKSDFLRDPNGAVIVYTDGACRGNGRNNAKAGIGVWFNSNHPLNVSAPVDCRPTSNNAEIQAATMAILQAYSANVKEMIIHTDSQFLIKCVTLWMPKWKTNGWISSTKKNVKNKDELIKLDSAISKMDIVKWQHIPGHSGSEGNELAHKLAQDGALLYKNTDDCAIMAEV